MCGIVGYIGKNEAKDYLLNGLENLEYRGYDSAGIAVFDGKETHVVRTTGRVKELIQTEKLNPVKGKVGIGHTRWATHGGVLVKNAHPQSDEAQKFFVVHNGIVENYQEIKNFLIKKGVTFKSDTDTEVIPALIAHLYEKNKNVEASFKEALKSLRGAYAVVMMSAYDPDHLYTAKLSSPMAIGVGDSGEMYIGSDATPLLPYTKQIVYLEDGEGAVMSNKDYKLFHILTDKAIERPAELSELSAENADMGEYPDFMLKEIHEAAKTIRTSLLGRLRPKENLIKLGGLDLVRDQLDYIDRFIVIGCGTSYYAGLVGELLLEEIANIPVEVQSASEFRYRTEPLSRSTAIIAMSQSGETADTIAALKKLKGTGILKLGIVNTAGSTIARMTDAGIYCHAGPEMAVASTKAFVAQVTIFLLLALHLSKTYKNYKKLILELESLPDLIEETFKLEKDIKKIAEKYSEFKDFLYIGRRYAYPVALEGALKLKELSYIHAEGFAGGEMKHGPLALIDKSFPTFSIALTNDLDEKTFSNMQEIHTRGGKIVALVDDINSPAAKLADDVIVVPKVSEQLQPLIAAVPIFMFAYYGAKALNRDIDKPRNLAKSVTVE